MTRKDNDDRPASEPEEFGDLSGTKAELVEFAYNDLLIRGESWPRFRPHGHTITPEKIPDTPEADAILLSNLSCSETAPVEIAYSQGLIGREECPSPLAHGHAMAIENATDAAAANCITLGDLLAGKAAPVKLACGKLLIRREPLRGAIARLPLHGRRLEAGLLEPPEDRRMVAPKLLGKPRQAAFLGLIDRCNRGSASRPSFWAPVIREDDFRRHLAHGCDALYDRPDRSLSIGVIFRHPNPLGPLGGLYRWQRGLPDNDRRLGHQPQPGAHGLIVGRHLLGGRELALGDHATAPDSIRQSLGGACWPRSLRAADRIRNVCAGNLPRTRQFETTRGSRDVRRATAPVPPRASITSSTVGRGCSMPAMSATGRGCVKPLRSVDGKILRARQKRPLTRLHNVWIDGGVNKDARHAHRKPPRALARPDAGRPLHRRSRQLDSCAGRHLVAGSERRTLTMIAIILAWIFGPAAIFALIGWFAPERPLTPEEAQEQADALAQWRSRT